jgi:hypothetical protein
MPAHRVTELMMRVHDAFAHLRGGGDDVDLFDRLYIALYVGKVRSASIGEAGVALFTDALKALIEAEQIKERHGRFGFTGPGLETVREAVALYEELLTLSTPRQMTDAQDEVVTLIRKGQARCPKALAVEMQGAMA